jgi:hypothetical protein
MIVEAANSEKGLPFGEVLDDSRFAAALAAAGVTMRRCVFDALTTLRAFLSQAIASKDCSCEAAVSRVNAERAARNERRCSPDSSAYCKARAKLPEAAIADLTRETGRQLHDQADEAWRWNGRRVILVDGSTLEMADTPENQAEYPQSSSQKPGLGFPMLRMVVLLSLASGALLDLASGPNAGKKTGEQSLFRQLWDALRAGDIVLGDCLYDSYRDIAQLKQRGVDSLFGKNASRNCDFSHGERLGPDDHLVTWSKPKYSAERYDSREEWEALPAEIEMRETRCVLIVPGHRTRTIMIVTTLLDAELYSAGDIIELFGQRWNCELDLRSIKQVLGLRRLHCKTPAMVRKELWVHLLAYNLIRTRMAQAAALTGQLPRRLSFTMTKQHIDHFADHLRRAGDVRERARLERELLIAIANSTLPTRPRRVEPRALKKRQQKYSYLTEPRSQARQRLAA